MLEERTRWAMQIHDGLTQSVTSAVLELQTLRHRIETDPADAIAELREVEDAIRHDLTRDPRGALRARRGTGATGPTSFAAFVAELVERWRLPARVARRGRLRRRARRGARHRAAHRRGGPHQRREALGIEGRHRAGCERTRGSFGSRSKTGVAASPPITDDDPHFGLRLMQTRAAPDRRLDRDRVRPPDAACRVIAVLPVGVQGEER